ncbi:MAG: alkaline phosphatase family protein [Nevskia sp.]
MRQRKLLLTALCTTLITAAGTLPGMAVGEPGDAAGTTALPTGQSITPTAAGGSRFQPLNPHLPEAPGYTVGHALTERLSPDGRTLLILTSGYNLVSDKAGNTIPADSSEWLFVFDVAGSRPVQRQSIPVPNTCAGLAWSADGRTFFVAGGADDSIHSYALAGTQWTEQGSAIKLGHASGLGIGNGPVAAGLAPTADGKRLLVANLENDTLSMIDLGTRAVIGETDLRPGKSDPSARGVAGGEFPYWVVVKGNETAYVSSLRDREIVVLDIRATPTVIRRIPLAGNPNKMVLNRSQTALFVTADNSDVVSVIDTRSNTVKASVRTAGKLTQGDAGESAGDKQDEAPASTEAAYYRGAVPNGLVLSADETRLYVSNAGINAVSVIDLSKARPRVLGLIPTGWYPNDVAVSADGRRLYVINGKSVAGANPGNCYGYGANCLPGSPVRYQPNQYVLQLTKAGFLTLPTPDTAALAKLTQQVVDNVRRDRAEHDDEAMAALRSRIKHVIYIVRENRTYDQVLGDLPVGNGDPGLTEFGRRVTPNQHALASGFVTLDNFFDSGEVSGNGWVWSTAARETDWTVHNIPLNYADRGTTYDSEGTNRNLNVGLAAPAARRAANPSTPADPDELPGTRNVGAPDGPDGEEQQGYLWDSALRAGLSVRNYGFFCDLARYSPKNPSPIPLERTPYEHGVQVAYPTNPTLLNRTDVYFRGYDNAFPDFYREREWEREFGQYVAKGDLPALSLVRFMHDHTGTFGRAIDGVNTPETQVADNDYAVGKLIEAVAASRYRDDTLIFVVEDDSQDGPDHVDAQRSIAFVAGPYVKSGAVVSRRYTTVSLLRTIEDVLGIGHLNLNDAYQPPMRELFDTAQAAAWSFKATPSSYLAATQLPIPASEYQQAALPSTHDGGWWARKSARFDFSVEDRLDAVAYNRLLWQGLMGDRPYPVSRSGKDLRSNRAARVSLAQ